MSLRAHLTASGSLYPTTGVATTTAPGALTLDMRGYGRCILTFAPAGSGASYDYSITSRSPAPNDGSAGAASGWAPVALGSGAVDNDGEVVDVLGDQGELQITLSSPSGAPSYLVHYYLTD